MAANINVTKCRTIKIMTQSDLNTSEVPVSHDVGRLVERCSNRCLEIVELR